ncbi:MAG: septal ring lytic transglycosylase RlpA family protein [Sphaerochaetaceae bacterium]
MKKILTTLLILIITTTIFATKGIASWYDTGHITANGDPFNPNSLSAAHKTMMFGSIVRVHNLDNNKTVDVYINDRGPYVDGRIIDLTPLAAKALGMYEAGLAKVELEIIYQPTYPISAYNRLGDTGIYKIQVGSFSNEERAKSLKQKLKENNLNVQTEITEDNLIRVIIKSIEEENLEETLKTLTHLQIDQLLIQSDAPLVVD